MLWRNWVGQLEVAARICLRSEMVMVKLQPIVSRRETVCLENYWSII